MAGEFLGLGLVAMSVYVDWLASHVDLLLP